MVRIVADGVNLRSELLSRSFRIFIEQRLNPVVMLLKQRPDLLPLRSQLQIFPCRSQHWKRDDLQPLVRKGLAAQLSSRPYRAIIPKITICAIPVR